MTTTTWRLLFAAVTLIVVSAVARGQQTLPANGRPSLTASTGLVVRTIQSGRWTVGVDPGSPFWAMFAPTNVAVRVSTIEGRTNVWNASLLNIGTNQAGLGWMLQGTGSVTIASGSAEGPGGGVRLSSATGESLTLAGGGAVLAGGVVTLAGDNTFSSNLTVSGSLTAPDATSTAPSAVANVGTLDARYVYVWKQAAPSGVTAISTNGQAAWLAGSAADFVPSIYGRCVRIEIVADGKLHGEIGAVRRTMLNGSAVGPTTNWSNPYGGVAYMPNSTIGIFAVNSNEWTAVTQGGSATANWLWTTNVSIDLSNRVGPEYYEWLYHNLTGNSSVTTNKACISMYFSQ